MGQGDIREYQFGAITTGSPNLSAQYTNYPIVGRILKVFWDLNGGHTGGSLWLGVSGTAEEVHRINGPTADTTAYPRLVPVDNTNASLSGNAPFTVERASNAPLFIAASGISFSSTGSGLSNVIVWYY